MTTPPASASPSRRPLGSRYVLLARIGRGAMGEVWRAEARLDDPLQGAPAIVAVKLLRPELREDPEAVERLLRERAVLTHLSHPNLVSVRDLVVEGSDLGIVMDFVDGPDLRGYLAARGGTIPPAEAVDLAEGILRGLAAVHAAGVIHRDVKPENVLLAREGNKVVPRVSDFGISQIMEGSRLTRSSVLIGTPEYLAPEIADGRAAQPASDIYSTGIVLYELLAGITPFAGGHPMAVIRRHADQTPGRPAGLPDSLWRVISSLLSKDPQDRPASAAQAASMLGEVAPGLRDLPALDALREPPASVVENLTQTVTRPSERGAAEAARLGRRRLVGLVAAVVLVLGAGGGVAYAHSRHSSSASASASASRAGTNTAQADSTRRSQPSATPSAPIISTATDSPTTSNTPAPGTPASGSSSPSPVSSLLTVVVPNVDGQDISTAEETLSNANLQYVVVEVIDSKVADGTVLATNPKAASAAAPNSTVTLTEGRQPVGTFLGDIGVVGNENAPSGDPVTMNGVLYTHAQSVDLDNSGSNGCNQGSTVSYDYDLGRDYQTLDMVAGVDDQSDSEADVQFETLVDGRDISTVSATLGKPVTLKIPVKGVLRLTVEATVLEKNCQSDITAVWGDAEVFGLPDVVPTPSPSD